MTAEPFWDPFSAKSWAKLLGLTHEALFGHSDADNENQHSVLLDGRAASFEFSHVRDMHFEGDDALSWTWSANMRHCVIVNELRERLLIRRWDTPSEVMQFKIPTREGAHNLLRMMHNSKSPRSPDVINWVLELFKYLLAEFHDATLGPNALNTALDIAREYSLGKIGDGQWHSARILDDMYKLRPTTHSQAFEVTNRGHIVLLAHCVDYLIGGPPRFGLTFRADLLFRHAASQLYQQAHLIIERDAQQFFPGFAPEPRFFAGPKEVRYTPNNLARSLAQESLNTLLLSRPLEKLDVLDPACGSGIFLQECVRECASRQVAAGVHLHGTDISPVAVQISDSCLRMAISEVEHAQQFVREISQGDSLTTNWPRCDLVLMNPPFCSWQNMNDADREAVAAIVNGVTSPRTDKAMAFVWKAIQALRPSGVLAAVLPRALLDNQSAADLRSEIGAIADIVMLGRFEGFSYFEHSLVETAFIILQKRREATENTAVRVLIADKGWEDASLRLLRGAEATQEELERVEIFDANPELFGESNWMPRRMSEIKLLEELDAQHLPLVGSLFDVQQGIRTGNKSAFLLSNDDVQSLPPAERKYFRQAAGQGTILQGKLIPTEWACNSFCVSRHEGYELVSSGMRSS